MSQYQSFFISASGNTSQCDELNRFLRSHVVIRTVENIINSGTNCGVQILIEYKDVPGSGEKNVRQKIDWRASLATDEQRLLFDRLKEFRIKLSKEKKLGAAYMVCKDEHLAAIVQKPEITTEEIKSLPNSSNILLKDFAPLIHTEFQKILADVKAESSTVESTAPKQESTDGAKNEADEIPF